MITDTNNKEEPSLNLYQKLLKIQQHIIGLGKNKAGHNYQYVTGDKVLEHIKPLMNSLGLLLKSEVLSIENTRQDYKTKYSENSEILSKVEMRFTWIDCDSGEREECLFGANGQNGWDKGVGSALTYAERYFLLKFFHIATDEDDIDNPDRKPQEEAPKKAAPNKAQTQTEEPASTKEKAAFLILLNGKQVDPKEKETVLSKLNNNEFTSNRLQAATKHYTSFPDKPKEPAKA